jgi:hypothetical protein
MSADRKAEDYRRALEAVVAISLEALGARRLGPLNCGHSLTDAVCRHCDKLTTTPQDDTDSTA